MILAEAYSGMIERYAWDWFCTLTFRPSRETGCGVHPEAADKAFRFFLSCLNRSIWGTRWYKKYDKQVIWARGQEFHISGKIHFHAVLAHPTMDLNKVARRLDWMDFWYENFGIARIEKVTSRLAVSSYVSKYVAKDGEVDFSPNFGISLRLAV